jgi:hypothetical protein
MEFIMSDSQMRRNHLIVIWSIVAYFAVVSFIQLPTAVWGTLGVFRPGDPGVTETTLPRIKTEAIFSQLSSQHSNMVILVVFGTLLLFGFAAWLTQGH